LLDPSIRRLSEADEELAFAVGREQQAVSSVLRLVPAAQRAEIEQSLRPALARLESFGKQQKERVRHAMQGRAGASQADANVEPDRIDSDAARIVVRRKRFGTVPLDDLPVDRWEGQPSGAWATVPTIALYWCDGKRTLAEVARLTQFELGPTNFDFVSYFRFLRKNGYVDFVAE
jgi:hypothetical protein